MPTDFITAFLVDSGTIFLAFIKAIAPLSVVIGALTFSHNYRQTRIKRDHEEASHLRNIFNQLGTKTYVLQWSMLGSLPSLVAAAVFQVREAIEQRVGKNPSDQEIAAFLSEQPLAEGLIEKVWRDTKLIEKFQADALEFGRLRAELGNRIPVIQSALKQIETKLRILFLLNTLVVFAMRNHADFESLKSGKNSSGRPAILELHRSILRATNSKTERESFSEACSFLENFCESTATVSDRNILSLARNRTLARRFGDWLSGWNRNPPGTKEAEILKKLGEKTRPETQNILKIAHQVIEQKKQSALLFHTIERSAAHIKNLVLQADTSQKSENSMYEFIKKLNELQNSDSNFIWALLELKAAGIDDPDIDIFLAVSCNDMDLLTAGLERGGNVNITDVAISARYDINLTNAQ